MTVRVAFVIDGAMKGQDYGEMEGWSTEFGNLHLVDQKGDIKVTYSHGAWHHVAGEGGAVGMSGSGAASPGTTNGSPAAGQTAGSTPQGPVGNKSAGICVECQAAGLKSNKGTPAMYWPSRKEAGVFECNGVLGVTGGGKTAYANHRKAA